MELERQLEEEEEYIVNKLQAKLREVTREKVDLEKKLSGDRAVLLDQLKIVANKLRDGTMKYVTAFFL